MSLLHPELLICLWSATFHLHLALHMHKHRHSLLSLSLLCSPLVQTQQAPGHFSHLFFPACLPSFLCHHHVALSPPSGGPSSAFTLSRQAKNERDNLCTLDGVCLSVVVVCNIISISSLQLTHWRQTVTAELLLSYQQMKKTKTKKTKKAPHTTRCPSTQDKTKSLRALHFHYFFSISCFKSSTSGESCHGAVCVFCSATTIFQSPSFSFSLLFFAVTFCRLLLLLVVVLKTHTHTAVILQRRSRKAVCVWPECRLLPFSLPL